MKTRYVLALFALWAGMGIPAARGQSLVLCAGDSITAGYGVSVSYPTRLRNNTGLSVVNAGVGGVSAGYGLAVIDGLMDQNRPSNVLILYGTNNMNRQDSDPVGTANTVLQIALRVRAKGGIPVIGTIPPMIGPRASYNANVRTFNSRLRSHASANGIALADIESAFGSAAGLMLSDGFHPNDAGAEVIARTFAAKIEVLNLSPSSAGIGDLGAIGKTFSVSTRHSWTATANNSWFTITGGASGSGNGTVTYSVNPNPGPARSGSITISGGGISRSFRISQDAAKLVLTPASISVSETGLPAGSFAVAANFDWTAAANHPWIEVTAGETGTSNGVVNYAVAANIGPARTGTVTVAINAQTRAFKVTQAASPNLKVTSRYGSPSPAIGTNWLARGTVVNAGVPDAPVVVGGTTQYVCTGWTGSGSVPKTGAGTNTGPFALTNNSTVTWLWRTNYWLATAAHGSGTVSVASRWVAKGSNVAIRATPEVGSRFFRWTGASTSTSSNAVVGMTSAKSITALFGVDLTVQARGLDGSAKGVAVRATPGDVFLKTSGTTPCKFGYTNGTEVALNAPGMLSGGWKLVGWTGVDSWVGTNAYLTAWRSNLVAVLYDPPPVVVITNPTSYSSWKTTNRVMNLRGRASSLSGLVRIEVSNARAERNRICTGTTNWSYDGLTLYPGVNPITVTAYDVYTNTAVDTVAVTYSTKSTALQGLALLAGAVVRDIQMPDNLVPGTTNTIQWQIEAYEPVRSGLKIRLPEGAGVTNVALNGRQTGSAPGSWTLGEWTSRVYSFETDWIAPNRPGTCRIRFLAARQDGFAYLNANLPDGVETPPYGMDGKEIARMIVAGGTTPALQNEALAKDAKPFETMTDAQRRAGAVIRNIAIPDNLVPGSVVTCKWTILSYPSLKSRLRIDLPVESDAFGTGTQKTTSNSVWRLPASGAIVEYNGTVSNDATAKVSSYYKMYQRNLQVVWTVPNDPGTCKIGFEVALTTGTNWVNGILREGVDGRIETNHTQILRDIAPSGAVPVPLVLGVTNTLGNINYYGDADWYEFTAATAGTYRVQTYLGTLSDTILKLYGPGNPNDLIQQNDNAVGLASRLILPLAPGTYYVKITAPPTKKGTYKLVAAPAP